MPTCQEENKKCYFFLHIMILLMSLLVGLTAYDRRHKYWVQMDFRKQTALDENSYLSYRTSPAMWDNTVLPATRHKWMRPALTPASKLILNLPTPEGWKAELT